MGIFGWRKYCLYFTLLFFICLAIINIGLIAYVIRVLNISRDGAGPVHFHDHSLRVEGQAEFTESLSASKISSYDQNSLSLVSNSMVSMQSGNSGIDVKQGKISAGTPEFDIVYENKSVLAATPDEFRISSNRTLVESELGLLVNNTLRASTIRGLKSTSSGSGSVSNGDLTIESETQQLALSALNDLSLSSTSSKVTVQALAGITLASPKNIVLNGSRIVLPDIPTAGAGTTNATTLCVCTSGKLFRTDGLCSAAAATVCN